jgi:hypothetical protein
LRKLLFNILTVSLAVELKRIRALETWSACELHTVENLRADKNL